MQRASLFVLLGVLCAWARVIREAPVPPLPSARPPPWPSLSPLPSPSPSSSPSFSSSPSPPPTPSLLIAPLPSPACAYSVICLEGNRAIIRSAAAGCCGGDCCGQSDSSAPPETPRFSLSASPNSHVMLLFTGIIAILFVIALIAHCALRTSKGRSHAECPPEGAGQRTQSEPSPPWPSRTWRCNTVHVHVPASEPIPVHRPATYASSSDPPPPYHAVVGQPVAPRAPNS